MFLEHVLMKNSKFPVAYARRLEFVSLWFHTAQLARSTIPFKCNFVF